MPILMHEPFSFSFVIYERICKGVRRILRVHEALLWISGLHAGIIELVLREQLLHLLRR
jgi:hypothetical protein